MGEHALHRQVGLAGVGRAQDDSRMTRGGGGAHRSNIHNDFAIGRAEKLKTLLNMKDFTREMLRCFGT
jgi:hypothetical protein